MKTLNFDCIVIGAGVSGMTASIYLKRANLNVAIIEKNAPGGQINQTALIENYPGFLEITGPDLAISIFNQVTNLGIPYKYGNVLEIIDNGEYKTIRTDQEELTCKYILIASGRRAKELGLDKEKQFINRGISYCALCDGYFYKEKDVVVIGGGNSAFGEALYLADLCKKVTIIHRNDKPRAEINLQKRVKEKANIELILNNEVKDLVEENGRLSSVKLKDETLINCSGLFIYIGFVPNSSFINCAKNYEYIIVDKSFETSIFNVFASGDVIDKSTYQIATAIGEAVAATDAIIKRNNM